MRKVESRLAEENLRVTNYLCAATESKLKHLSETELITNHARRLVDMDISGSICLMRDDKLEDLKRMYLLFARVPSTLDILRGKISLSVWSFFCFFCVIFVFVLF